MIRGYPHLWKPPYSISILFVESCSKDRICRNGRDMLWCIHYIYISETIIQTRHWIKNMLMDSCVYDWNIRHVFCFGIEMEHGLNTSMAREFPIAACDCRCKTKHHCDGILDTYLAIFLAEICQNVHLNRGLNIEPASLWVFFHDCRFHP